MCLSREGRVLGRKSMVSFGLSRLKLVAAMMFSLVAIGHAHALTIELKDVAADRLERQRAFQRSHDHRASLWPVAQAARS